MIRKIAGRITLTVALCGSAPASAQWFASSVNSDEVFRPWPVLALTPFLSGLNEPVLITDPRDGTDRLFIVEHGGRIRVAVDGVVQPQAVLDLSTNIVTSFEEGLLSMAFPPGFSTQQHFYVSYNRAGDRGLVVSRFQMSTNSPDRAQAGSEEILFVVEKPNAIHSGGHLLFGPNDGYLRRTPGGSLHRRRRLERLGRDQLPTAHRDRWGELRVELPRSA
ncbi:MAG: PQQ-dependent sugar dehydrogenase [Verrucomicrobia bacterium]|nr:PQQ-dependent sugar dehydrogenase [Verrucomicrobiota bacterium]MDA1087895.1 PQQ-dependent sugar dehydrogenase [Verrucomicrobiota bacterium]